MRRGTRNTIEAWLLVLLTILLVIVGFIIRLCIIKAIFGFTFGA